MSVQMIMQKGRNIVLSPSLVFIINKTRIRAKKSLQANDVEGKCVGAAAHKVLVSRSALFVRASVRRTCAEASSLVVTRASNVLREDMASSLCAATSAICLQVHVPGNRVKTESGNENIELSINSVVSDGRCAKCIITCNSRAIGVRPMVSRLGALGLV